jgi:hypothetical protein
MPRLVGSYEIFSQGILVALVTRMGRKLWELGNTLSLEDRYVDICILDLYLDSYTNPPLSLYKVKLLLPPTLKLIKFLNSSSWTSLFRALAVTIW